MKRSILMLIVVISVILSGCSNGGDQSVRIKELEQKISDLENENKELKEKLVEDVETLSDLNTESNSGQENDDEIENVQIGSVITTDRMEIVIKNIEFSYDVLPDDTSSFYTHYPADAGQVYIHVDTDIKNLQKQNLDCDDILSIKANYNDGYTYNSSTVPEDDSTGFTYANIKSIKPLETLGVRFLIKCPQEVEETDDPLFLIFKVDKKEYKYVMR